MLAKFFRRRAPASPHEALDEALSLAMQGRRMAIYERTTGLHAYWYLELRAEEEISRARRDSRPLACLSIWASSPEHIAAVGSYLRERRRPYDMAAYLNNGHFVVLLPATDGAGAETVTERIVAAAGNDLLAGLALHPADGRTFEELLTTAKTRAAPIHRAA